MLPACNKTYTGEPGGAWHSLSVPRPRGDMLPFSCYLSFSARQDDTIQLSFSHFRLGRFQSSSSLGCPDGHLAITEDRPGGPGPPGSGSGSGFLCGDVSNNTRGVARPTSLFICRALAEWFKQI